MKIDQTYKESFPLAIIIEYRMTCNCAFKPSDTLDDICQKALQKVWKERADRSTDWRITDRDGLYLPIDVKFDETNFRPRDPLHEKAVVIRIAKDRR